MSSCIFAAEGYARSKMMLVVVLLQQGQVVQMLLQECSAWIDSYTCCICSRSSFLNQTIKKQKRQIGVQEINIIDIVKPITKFSIMITDPNSINYYLEKAYDICKSGRPGPVFIDIPADMQNAKIDEKNIKV